MSPSELGSWHIVATTLPFWRGKSTPQVTYTQRPDGRWDDVLTWDTRGRSHRLRGVDAADGEGFVWRGVGILALLESRWRFVEVTDTTAITWFSRASFGVTPEGMDVYGRTRDVDAAAIVTRLQADPRFAHIDGWYLTD